MSELPEDSATRPGASKAVSQKPTPAAAPPPEFNSMLSHFMSALTFRRSEAPPLTVPARRVNPFMALRQGHRMIVIAAVDGGVASFFRLGQGAFEEWPMA
jgi:tRNA-splicing endonuclease subunit Sen54